MAQLDLGQQAWGGPLAAGSERSFTQPLVIGGVVFFTTFIPDENICAGSGETWVFAVDYQTGLPLKEPVFDLNNDGVWDAKDMIDIDNDGDKEVAPIGIRVGRGKGSRLWVAPRSCGPWAPRRASAMGRGPWAAASQDFTSSA